MADYSFSIDVHGEDIIVSFGSPGFIAVYSKPAHQPQLVLCATRTVAAETQER